MGLLDIFNSDDGRLGIGLLAAAGPRADGAGFGQRLQEAMTGFASQKDADMKRKYLQAQLENYPVEQQLQRQLQQAQISNYVSEADQRRAAIAKQAAEQADLQLAGQTAQKFFQPGRPAMGAVGSVDASLPPELQAGIQLPARPAQAPSFDMQGFASARMAQNPVAGMALLQGLQKSQPKYSTTPQQMMVGGKLTNVLVAEDGSIKTLDGFGVKPEMVEQDLGGFKQWVDKNRLQPDQTFTKTQTPDNKATVGAAYDNANATRAVAAATRDAASIQAGFAAEQGLRKEFEGLSEVKNYKQAYPAYAAVVDAAGRNTPQSDINLVYGIAKLYDPTSVVREGEYATVANSPNIPERIKGFAQYLAGGGRLSPETKQQILAEAKGRIGTYEAEATKAKSSYEVIARKRGMEPASVFADMGNLIANPEAKPAPLKTATLADIAATAKASGKSTAEVTKRLKEKGYSIVGGQP